MAKRNRGFILLAAVLLIFALGMNARNSVGQDESTFQINPAISDAWFFPDTAGQGFFIIVWEDSKLVFLAWFTYDTERPPEDVTAFLGESGHRWLTALGPYEGDTALLDVFLSSGMIFDSAEPPVTTEQLDGATIEIVWSDCKQGLVKYNIPSLGLMGEIPIQRIVDDNVALCEALNGPTAAVQVTPAAATLFSLGEMLQLTASALDANGNTITGKTFTWSSSDESITTVTDSGLVTALANGPAVTITAATDGVEGTAAIAVGAGVSPSARAFHAMAYDAESDRVILLGGGETDRPIKGTWAYDFDTNSWTDMNPATSPEAGASFARLFPAMAYDAQSDRVILFGGDILQFGDFDPLSDTWAYDFNTNSWTDMNPTSSAPARSTHGMVYDARSDRVILYGGLGDHHPVGPNPTFYADTWAYDFDTNAWTELSPSTNPNTGGSCHALAYDAESGRVILFGGHTFRGLLSDDTWAYAFNTNAWTVMNPAPRPLIQEYMAMAYDVESDRVILFGGAGGSETWAYDFNRDAWTRMNSVVHPSGRWGHAMAYDEGSDRVVLFGGERGSGPLRFLGETWAYDFNTDTWTPVH